MNRFKIQAFFKEFSWLRDLLGGGSEGSVFRGMLEDALRSRGDEGRDFVEGVEEVNVKRIDENFLNYIPVQRGATGSLVSINDDENILLVDANGNILKWVEQSRDITHNEAYHDDEKEEGESVGEALACLDNPNNVAYAVCIHTGHRIWGHRSIGGFSVTVYKPPKGFTLKEWADEQRRRAEQILTAEIAQIDAEAKQ
jgi:hypothetical protein